MTAREELQHCYELAFFPPSLNRLWREIKSGDVDIEQAKSLLDKALMLHQALPEYGYASQRALSRLALYQAQSRAFGMVTFLKNIREYLNLPALDVSEVPPHLIRDIGLPSFSRAKS